MKRKYPPYNVERNARPRHLFVACGGGTGVVEYTVIRQGFLEFFGTIGIRVLGLSLWSHKTFEALERPLRILGAGCEGCCPV